jgi:hypothetical protein
MLRKVLLGCGIISSVLYVAADVLRAAPNALWFLPDSSQLLRQGPNSGFGPCLRYLQQAGSFLRLGTGGQYSRPVSFAVWS